MTERKPQIAYAPVNAAGIILVSDTRIRARDARATVSKHTVGGWQRLREVGWRIKRVRVEIDE